MKDVTIKGSESTGWKSPEHEQGHGHVPAQAEDTPLHEEQHV